MTNIDDFINWWKGFRDGIGSANITQEHLDMIEKKINGLVDLWDISLPPYDEQEEKYVYPTQIDWPNSGYGWPYTPPLQLPKISPNTYPQTPPIWCREWPVHIGTPRNPSHVGTPLTHLN